MTKLKKIFLLSMVLLLFLTGCKAEDTTKVKAGGEYPDAVNIELGDNGILVDGEAVAQNADAAVYVAKDRARIYLWRRNRGR